jgi:dTDP-glucose pyrophosphorylase
MKALILTGGRGTRFGLVDKNKCAVKILGKPLVNYTIDIANAFYHDGKIDETIIVVGDRRRDIISVNGSKYLGMPLRYALQKGDTALSAILSAENCIDDSFMLLLGDEIYYKYNYDSMLYNFRKNDYDGIIGYVEADKYDIKKTYTFRIRKEHVTKIVEKPEKPFNKYMGTGNCILPLEFFDWADMCIRMGVGDFPTAINYGIRSKKANFGYSEVAKKYFNINTMREYDEAIKFLREIV